MHAEAYEVIIQASPALARDQERQAFDRGIALMEEARRAPSATGPRHAAVRYMQTLWSFLIRDLSDPANALSTDLKDNLIAIGFWSIREADAIVAGRSDDWGALIEINSAVRDGLAT